MPKPKPRKVPETLEGRISVSAGRDGYLTTPGTNETTLIPYPLLHTALHGDTVKVKIRKTIPNRYSEGEVTDIIARSKFAFSGVLKKGTEGYFVQPDDPKCYVTIRIPEKSLLKSAAGDKVFAEITDWKDAKKGPFGKITERFGKDGEHNAEMESIVRERGFASSFSPSIEKHAHEIEKRGITAKDIEGRRDMRLVPTCTIDPDNAKDFDDALSVEYKDSGDVEIGIHIADVSHYVHEGDTLDREAFERGTSVYLVDRTIPMLPEALSNNLCSLMPDVDRLAASVIVTFDPSGHRKDIWFGRTIIRSGKRFSYEAAQKVLSDQRGVLHKELITLNTIAKKLRKQRFEEGSLALDQEEVSFTLNENGVPIAIKKKVRTDTHFLVEEFMLLANKCVAEYMKAKGGKNGVFMYRIHDLPNQEKMRHLFGFLQQLGYKVPKMEQKIKLQDLDTLLRAVQGKPEHNLVHTSVIRAMAKAIYSTKNIGHYGLGFADYTHFTSPIRRYPDIVAHRLLFKMLASEKVISDTIEKFEEIAAYASERERYAAEAERASVKYKQVEYMSMHIGETFAATVTGIIEKGIFVETDDTKCEGMVQSKFLGSDRFKLNEKTLSLTGEKTGKQFRIGDKVTVKVRATDMYRKVIDYELVK